MAKRRKNAENSVVETPATELNAQVSLEKAPDELVMSAKIEKKEEVKKESTSSFQTTCVITNTSQNKICLFNGNPFESISIDPREIKQVSRHQLRELMKNKMVQRFFDKGILTHNMDASEVSAHDAVVPQELVNPVERHEDGQNVKAEVKKFEKDGSVHIEL